MRSVENPGDAKSTGRPLDVDDALDGREVDLQDAVLVRGGVPVLVDVDGDADALVDDLVAGVAGYSRQRASVNPVFVAGQVFSSPAA